MKLVVSCHYSNHSRYQIWRPHTIQICLTSTILIHRPRPSKSSTHRPRPPRSPTRGLAPPGSPTHGLHPPTSPTHGLAPLTSPTHRHGPPLGQSSGADTLLGERTTAQSVGLYTHSCNTGHDGKHSLPPSTERILPINAAHFGLHDCMA